MDAPMVKLRWLEYFAAVAEELHFGRAAARLHLSPPALSRQVRELEAALGAPLFDRTSRSVRLTPAGKALYVKVQPGLSLLAEGIGDVVELAPDTPAPTLTVGFVSALSGKVIPDALRRFRTAWPKTRVRLEQLPSREQLQRLAAGTLDAGFYGRWTTPPRPAPDSGSARSPRRRSTSRWRPTTGSPANGDSSCRSWLTRSG